MQHNINPDDNSEGQHTETNNNNNNTNNVINDNGGAPSEPLAFDHEASINGLKVLQEKYQDLLNAIPGKEPVTAKADILSNKIKSSLNELNEALSSSNVDKETLPQYETIYNNYEFQLITLKTEIIASHSEEKDFSPDGSQDLLQLTGEGIYKKTLNNLLTRANDARENHANKIKEDVISENLSENSLNNLNSYNQAITGTLDALNLELTSDEKEDPDRKNEKLLGFIKKVISIEETTNKDIRDMTEFGNTAEQFREFQDTLEDLDSSLKLLNAKIDEDIANNENVVFAKDLKKKIAPIVTHKDTMNEAAQKLEAGIKAYEFKLDPNAKPTGETEPDNVKNWKNTIGKLKEECNTQAAELANLTTQFIEAAKKSENKVTETKAKNTPRLKYGLQDYQNIIDWITDEIGYAESTTNDEEIKKLQAKHWKIYQELTDRKEVLEDELAEKEKQSSSKILELQQINDLLENLTALKSILDEAYHTDKIATLCKDTKPLTDADVNQQDQIKNFFATYNIYLTDKEAADKADESEQSKFALASVDEQTPEEKAGYKAEIFNVRATHCETRTANDAVTHYGAVQKIIGQDKRVTDLLIQRNGKDSSKTTGGKPERTHSLWHACSIPNDRILVWAMIQVEDFIKFNDSRKTMELVGKLDKLGNFTQDHIEAIMLYAKFRTEIMDKPIEVTNSTGCYKGISNRQLNATFDRLINGACEKSEDTFYPVRKIVKQLQKLEVKPKKLYEKTHTTDAELQKTIKEMEDAGAPDLNDTGAGTQPSLGEGGSKPNIPEPTGTSTTTPEPTGTSTTTPEPTGTSTTTPEPTGTSTTTPELTGTSTTTLEPKKFEV